MQTTLFTSTISLDVSDDPVIDIGVLCIESVCVIIGTWIFLMLVKTLYCSDSESLKELSSYFLHGTMIAVFLYYISLIILTTYSFVLYIQHDLWFQYIFVGEIIGIFIYFGGRWSMLLLFVFRIDLSFRDSVLQYSKKVLFTLYIIVYFMPFLLIVMFIFVGIFPHASGAIAILTAFIWILLEFILSVTLIILFIYKLLVLFRTRANHVLSTVIANNLSLSSSEHKSNSMKRAPTTTKSETVIVSIETIKMMTKYTLLVVVSILSSSINMIIALWIDLALFYYFFFAVDCVINALCLYLILNQPHPKHIYGFLCKYCNSFCEKCCIYCLSCSNHLKYEDCQGVIINV
eukprot:61501_1